MWWTERWLINTKADNCPNKDTQYMLQWRTQPHCLYSDANTVSNTEPNVDTRSTYLNLEVTKKLPAERCMNTFGSNDNW